MIKKETLDNLEKTTAKEIMKTLLENNEITNKNLQQKMLTNR